MASKKHQGPHKYRRKWLGKNKEYEVYACVLPGCLHYIVPDLLEGKESICWRCNKVFTMTNTTKELAKPHCKNCTKGKKVEEKPKSNFKNKGHLPEIDLSDLV